MSRPSCHSGACCRRRHVGRLAWRLVDTTKGDPLRCRPSRFRGTGDRFARRIGRTAPDERSPFAARVRTLFPRSLPGSACTDGPEPLVQLGVLDPARPPRMRPIDPRRTARPRSIPSGRPPIATFGHASRTGACRRVEPRGSVDACLQSRGQSLDSADGMRLQRVTGRGCHEARRASDARARSDDMGARNVVPGIRGGTVALAQEVGVSGVRPLPVGGVAPSTRRMGQPRSDPGSPRVGQLRQPGNGTDRATHYYC